MMIDREALSRHLDDVNALLSTHAGAVEILDVSAGGVVSLRFTGKCTGCELKALTLAASVRPSLMAVDGVTEVVATGACVSEEATRRISEAIGGDAARRRWLAKIHHRRQDEAAA
jgi:Fe-S cluster biogenesis protein NfuA